MALKPILIRLPEELIEELKREKKQTGATLQHIIITQISLRYDARAITKARKVKRG